MSEKWKRMYNQDWEIYEKFASAEDAFDSAWKSVVSHVDFSNKSVFEMGCGTGKYTDKIAAIADKVYANDISKIMIDKAKERCSTRSNIEYIHASAENNRLPENSVDIVFSAWGYVAGDLIFAKKIEEEFQRILKPGGEVWLLDNYYEGEFNSLRGKKADVMYAEEQLGYELVQVIPTVFCFDSVQEAGCVLGYILGEDVKQYVVSNKIHTINDKVALLRKRW